MKNLRFAPALPSSVVPLAPSSANKTDDDTASSSYTATEPAFGAHRACREVC
jgi:hypothetical protein